LQESIAKDAKKFAKMGLLSDFFLKKCKFMNFFTQKHRLDG